MKRVTICQQSSLYQPFTKLYARSFPIFEQRTEHQQKQAFASEQYKLVGYVEEGTFIGFIAYWKLDSVIYVEHFAIQQSLRGQGYGSRVLNEFVAKQPKIVLLEIDPVVDEIAAARLRFYQKSGFVTNPFTHVHRKHSVKCIFLGLD